jgi:hypothetical protein
VSLDAVDDPALVAAAIARGVGVGEASRRQRGAWTKRLSKAS